MFNLACMVRGRGHQYWGQQKVLIVPSPRRHVGAFRIPLARPARGGALAVPLALGGRTWRADSSVCALRAWWWRCTLHTGWGWTRAAHAARRAQPLGGEWQNTRSLLCCCHHAATPSRINQSKKAWHQVRQWHLLSTEGGMHREKAVVAGLRRGHLGSWQVGNGRAGCVRRRLGAATGAQGSSDSRGAGRQGGGGGVSGQLQLAAAAAAMRGMQVSTAARRARAVALAVRSRCVAGPLRARVGWRGVCGARRASACAPRRARAWRAAHGAARVEVQ